MSNAVGWLKEFPVILFGLLMPSLFGAVGLLMAHHPMILSRFATIQTDLGDPRLINFILEHSYRWIHGDPRHVDFWSPQFFFPTKNVGAYSDVLLTIAPIYWFFRGFGMAPDSAFQGWIFVVSTLNYSSAFFLFRRGFGFTTTPATAGAFLLAFGSPRINQLDHHQLMPVFYCLGTLFALTRLFSLDGPKKWMRWVWWQIAALSLVAQLYAAFYPGWFLVLGIGFYAAWAVLLPNSRGSFLRTCWGDTPAILAATVVGMIFLRPFLTHYLAAARELGARDYQSVRLSILQCWSWFYVGPNQWLWGSSAKLPLFRMMSMEQEKRVGLGLLTPVICILGLFLGCNRLLIRIASLVAFTLMLISVELPGELLANLGVISAILIAARFYHDRSRLGSSVLALGALVVLATFESFPSWRVIGLNLYLTSLCLVEAFRVRRQPVRIVPPLILVLWLCFKLFDPYVMGIGFVLVGLAVSVGEILHRSDRVLIRLIGLSVWWLFLVLVTYPHHPGFVLFGLGTPVVLGLTRIWEWPPGAHRPMANALIVALWAIVLLEHHDSLWYYIYEFVPGGTAIRAVGRVGLLVLIPASIGLAAFFSTPWVARNPLVAVLIGACCLTEQGVTTPTYNKFADRERVAALSKLVDPKALAFYYRPSPAVFHIYQIDAMWMSLYSGVPTLNGYSGGFPRGWFPLMKVEFAADLKDAPTPRKALAGWIDLNHLPHDRIQEIGVFY